MPVDQNATVHVVDDEFDVRRSVAFLLGAAGFTVETYASGRSLLEAAARLAPGCVLTDVKMPGIDGLQLQEKLAELRKDLPVIVMTGVGDIAMAVRAMRAGAVDFIEKPFDDESLVASVRMASRKAERIAAERAEGRHVMERLAALTAREREVMDLLVQGHLNKQIAHELGISQRTVEVYRAAIMDKMCAGGLAHLVRMALSVERARDNGAAPVAAEA